MSALTMKPSSTPPTLAIRAHMWSMWAAPNVLANWASRCGSRSCSRRFTERAYPISVESIYSEGNFATVAGKASANGAVHLAATDSRSGDAGRAHSYGSSSAPGPGRLTRTPPDNVVRSGRSPSPIVGKGAPELTLRLCSYLRGLRAPITTLPITSGPSKLGLVSQERGTGRSRAMSNYNLAR